MRQPRASKLIKIIFSVSPNQFTVGYSGHWRENANFRLYYKSTVTKTVWPWHKYRHKSVKQYRELRNKPIHLWSTKFLPAECLAKLPTAQLLECGLFPGIPRLS